MDKEIYLDPSQVPAHLRGTYSGKSFKAEVCETVHVPADAGLWCGGSRDSYRLVRLSDGATVPAVNHNAAPWDAERGDKRIPLAPGFAVVRHTMFCGKDLGLTFYVYPADAAAMLPAPAADLTEAEAIVLEAVCSLKSSYNGKDRYEMTSDNWRYRGDGKPFMSRADWDNAKAALISRGMLNRAGAVTVTGRNARRR